MTNPRIGALVVSFALASAGDTFGLERVHSRAAEYGSAWSGGNTTTLSYFNVCNEWTWTWLFYRDERLGVCFESPIPDPVLVSTTSSSMEPRIRGMGTRARWPCTRPTLSTARREAPLRVPRTFPSTARSRTSGISQCPLDSSCSPRRTTGFPWVRWGTSARIIQRTDLRDRPRVERASPRTVTPTLSTMAPWLSHCVPERRCSMGCVTRNSCGPLAFSRVSRAWTWRGSRGPGLRSKLCIGRVAGSGSKMSTSSTSLPTSPGSSPSWSTARP